MIESTQDFEMKQYSDTVNSGTMLLRIEGLKKSFGTTQALNNAELSLDYGQILGLIGENGSGKSTLGSIVARMQIEDSGKITLEGKPYTPRTAVQANELGICMIMQEKGTFEKMSVAKNIFLGKESLFVRSGLLNIRKMETEAQNALDMIQSGHIKAEWPLAKLSFENRKLVELAKAMYTKPKILIVDETTSALSKEGREILYRIMRRMKSEGRSVIFITHVIDEMVEHCDKITVLRDGVYAGSLEKNDFDKQKIKQMMVGREVADNYYRLDTESSGGSAVSLRIEHINTEELNDINFELHQGEILGIGGLTESGMLELGRLIFGIEKPGKGSIRTAEGVEISSPGSALKQKIAYISKDRDQESLIVTASIADNINLPSYFKLKKGAFIWPWRLRNFSLLWAEKLEVKMRGINQYIMELSGGNKQKVVLAKWLGFGADIFILDCPTRGIDIGVKENIYNLMRKLKSEGKSILLISEEMAEIIGMSDRVITLKDGKVSGTFYREDGLTEGRLIEYMI
jgi:ribose transport system ATP-binding protein